MILTKLGKNDFQEVLANYNIGSYRSHKHIPWSLSNTTYILRTSKGKFVLKIFENRNPKFIAYRTKLAEFAEKNNLPVPKTVETKAGKDLLPWGGKRLAIEEFVEGKHPKNLDIKLIKNIAGNLALLDKNLMKIKLEGKYTWGKGYHFRHNAFQVSKYDNFSIRKEEMKILEGLKNVKKKMLRKSHVHGDFHTVNLLVKNNRLKAILDWDDAHEDYFIFDPMGFMAHSFIFPHKIDYNKIMIFLKEYQKILKFNKEEKRALYYFIKQRYLGAICWHIKQLKNHPDMAKIIKSRTRGLIDTYKHFNKVSLQEFIKLF